MRYPLYISEQEINLAIAEYMTRVTRENIDSFGVKIFLTKDGEIKAAVTKATDRLVRKAKG